MSLINLLSTDNYIVVNRVLIQKLGLHSAVLLGELANEYLYFSNRNELTEDGFFYSTVKNVKERTGLSDSQQRSALTAMENMGILQVEQRGMPAKRYIKLYEIVLENMLSVRTSSLKIEEQVLKKLKTKNNNIKNNLSNTNVLEDSISNNINIIAENSEKEKPHKKNLYEQCVDLVNKIAYDDHIKDVLVEFLKYHISKYRADGQSYRYNIFSQQMDKLMNIDKEQWEWVIRTTMQRGYKGLFIPDKNEVKKKTFITDEGVSSKKYTKEELEEVNKLGDGRMF